LEKDELLKLRNKDNIIFRYVVGSHGENVETSPNGATDSIAGVCNDEGNILGMMPHPERASESILTQASTTDGLKVFHSLLSMI
ncbi:MAG: phosphoribosylformylglycinamidine synthase subunit PurQ, partial [Nitrososphaerales archaeon]